MSAIATNRIDLALFTLSNHRKPLSRRHLLDVQRDFVMTSSFKQVVFMNTPLIDEGVL